MPIVPGEHTTVTGGNKMFYPTPEEFKILLDYVTVGAKAQAIRYVMEGSELNKMQATHWVEEFIKGNT